MRLAAHVIRAAMLSAVVGLASSVQPNAQQQPSAPIVVQPRLDDLNDVVDVGRFAYEAHCEICHGIQGAGPDREPYWNYLSKDIPNLAGLSVRNGGSFPFAKVYETIDGRHRQIARGPSDMPVWGTKFKAESVGLNSAYDSEGFARAKILALAEYIYRLQRTGTDAKKFACQPNNGNDGLCARSIEFVSEFDNLYLETLRTASAGLSSVTAEQTSGEAAYFAAYVERPDGTRHPSFGGDERQFLLYKMPSGKLVVRVIEAPPESYWPGAH